MGKKKLKKSKLRKSEIEKFKALLLSKRNEILGDVSFMEKEALQKESSELSSVPIHMADIGSDNFEVENTLGLVCSERKILTKIDEALERIEKGIYGICEGDGEMIGRERLEAILWTSYCVECASKIEKGLFVREEEIEELEIEVIGAAELEEESGGAVEEELEYEGEA